MRRGRRGRVAHPLRALTDETAHAEEPDPLAILGADLSLAEHLEVEQEAEDEAEQEHLMSSGSDAGASSSHLQRATPCPEMSGDQGYLLTMCLL